MGFIVVYDACVLYPASLRDLLVCLASKRVVEARWSSEILNEFVEALKKRQPHLAPDRLNRTCDLMNQAVPEALVTGHEQIMETLTLPDPDDRHVLATAIIANAQVIVTQNLKDFPEAALAVYDIEALHPDQFLLDTIDLAPGAVCETLAELVADLRNPPMTRNDLLDRLEKIGLTRSVARLSELIEA